MFDRAVFLQGEATALDHEILDDAVKDRVVEKALVHISEEVLHRLGSLFLVQLDRDVALSGFDDDFGPRFSGENRSGENEGGDEETGGIFHA